MHKKPFKPFFHQFFIMPKQFSNEYKLSKEEININNELYKDFINEYGNTPEGLGWNSKKQQELRFEIMLKIAEFCNKPIDNSSILDIGCGFADLYNYMQEKKHQVSYTGVDINPYALKTAAERYNSINLIEGNILQLKIPKHDFVFSSGLFATKINDNNRFIKAMLTRMMELANKGIAFNFLQKTQFESNLAEYDKKEIYRFCKKNFKNVKMFDNYLGSEDVTILISKEKM